jgi:threonine/homoserine/homoserine lactone efflux protein
MALVLSSVTLLKGFVLGWSVAWPPGPINAEMIRRTLLPRAKGGGFWSAWRLGLGACTGDFLWALGVATGAGAVMNTPTIRAILGVISFALLLGLAVIFAIGAWRVARDARTQPLEGIDGTRLERAPSHGYWLGFTIALTSPWNIGFWFAVIGSQQSGGPAQGTFGNSVLLAASVVSGAIAWTLVLCFAVKQGARIFAKPAWQIGTQALTSALMLFFAVKLLLQLR